MLHHRAALCCDRLLHCLYCRFQSKLRKRWQTYGDALFELAVEENKVDSLLKEIGVLQAVLKENDEFGKLMTHPKINSINRRIYNLSCHQRCQYYHLSLHFISRFLLLVPYCIAPVI